MIYIGEAFEGSGPEAAHISLILGPNDDLAQAFALAAASPGPGHIPFQVVLQPNLAARPTTLFIAKAVLRDERHEKMTWGPAQAGVAAGITEAVLSGALPPGAEEAWLALALVWVDWNAAEEQAVYANNRAATLEAAKRAVQAKAPTREALAAGLAGVGNPYFMPRGS